jgi:tetratricopeptide (TPR) repeat protein
MKITEVSSDIENLRLLKERCGWTPGAEQIRPSEHVKNKKIHILASVLNTFSTPLDYLLSSVFSAPTRESSKSDGDFKLTTKTEDGRPFVPISTAGVLCSNEFPYNVDDLTYHSVCWYPFKSRPNSLRSVDISSDIERCLNSELGHANYEAVWYENPKMTIPELYHVQVFWHKTTESTTTTSSFSATISELAPSRTPPATSVTTTTSTLSPTTTAGTTAIKASTEWKKASLELSSRVDSMKSRQQKKRRKRVRPRSADAYVEACEVLSSRFVSEPAIISTEKFMANAAAETYGELQVDEVYTLLEACVSFMENGGMSRISLLDVGSGHGKVVLLSSLFCNKVTGVESVPSRHEAALNCLEEFVQRVHPLMPSDHTHCNPQFLLRDMFKISWHGYNVIYACSTCFSADMMVRIAEKSAKELDQGAILCTVTHSLPDVASKDLQQLKTIMLQFTWGKETVFFYQQKEIKAETETKAETKAETKTEHKNSDLTTADKHNKAGSMFQNLGCYEKAIAQYRVALRNDKTHAASHFNMATCLCNLAQKNEGTNIAVAFRRKARSHYVKATEYSSNGFGEAHSNLAVLYLKENMLDKALASCEVALSLHDISTMSYNKAFWNLSSVLRRMGQKHAAIERAWLTIETAATSTGGSSLERTEDNDCESNKSKDKSKDKSCFVRPATIQCDEQNPPQTDSEMLSVICVKWGTKYGPEYVLRLFAGVSRNLSLPFKFVCFTDDVSGLEQEEGIHCLPLEDGWNGWWNKASLFSATFPLQGRILYIDLDTVVTESMNQMAAYRGDFAILSTKGIDNEGKDFSNGYNSSILMWSAGSHKLSNICEVLREHFTLIHRFIHRFDHWLEMMVSKADLIQEMFPGHVVDYVNACTVAVPVNARIVVFPLRPKPHEFPAPWVKEIWLKSELKSNTPDLTNKKLE